MLSYNWPGDALYGKYTTITEEEATQLLHYNRNNLIRLLNLAIKTAISAHQGQVDKGGNPYISHAAAVADSLESLEDKIVALLHDVLKDTYITVEYLLKVGFTKRIVNSIKILTKSNAVSYDRYLELVKKDNIAWNVKRADILHNMDINRIPNPGEKDFARIEKYKKALAFLES